MNVSDPEPEITVRGPGEASLAVVGSIHGDEPSGAEAIRRVLNEDLEYSEAVKFVVANPPALEAGERYVDVDMNRNFPGDSESDEVEERLAAKICDATKDCTVLALHSTRSQPEPFALFTRSQTEVLEVASELPVKNVVDETRIGEGSYTACSPVVSVECGCQETETATDTAERMIRSFLTVTGAVAGGEVSEEEPDYFTIDDSVSKRKGTEYELHVDNFELVREGEVYASTPEFRLVADRDFFPILMSEDGYEEILGFRGSRVATSLREATEAYRELDG